jgi:hypothetical protein
MFLKGNLLAFINFVNANIMTFPFVFYSARDGTRICVCKASILPLSYNPSPKAYTILMLESDFMGMCAHAQMHIHTHAHRHSSYCAQEVESSAAWNNKKLSALYLYEVE